MCLCVRTINIETLTSCIFLCLKIHMVSDNFLLTSSEKALGGHLTFCSVNDWQSYQRTTRGGKSAWRECVIAYERLLQVRPDVGDMPEIEFRHFKKLLLFRYRGLGDISKQFPVPGQSSSITIQMWEAAMGQCWPPVVSGVGHLRNRNIVCDRVGRKKKKKNIFFCLKLIIKVWKSTFSINKYPFIHVDIDWRVELSRSLWLAASSSKAEMWAAGSRRI